MRAVGISQSYPTATSCWINAEEDGTGPQSAMLQQDDIVDALRAVARGDIAAVSTIIERAQANE